MKDHSYFNQNFAMTSIIVNGGRFQIGMVNEKLHVVSIPPSSVELVAWWIFREYFIHIDDQIGFRSILTVSLLPHQTHALILAPDNVY